ncbi:polysaccharide pyruvyl transferase family protein [Lentibacter algarum]|uniref:polysaccharide pyruvyl transferase family protein n=1 Tax=Lentibacter algarum TaxID=576131 RepID=UPI002493C2FF|nr:polysaccharide pyruvyl transferase family protein [Lentibacter algarum]
MTKVVFLDFASEVNRGDAIMQEVFYNSAIETLKASQISVISVYGRNQNFDAPEHFDLTARYKPKIYPNLRNSGNKLSQHHNSSKWKNAVSLLIALFQLLILRISGTFLGRPDQKAVITALKSADYIIWNGRNFRDRRGIGELYDIFCMLISAQIALTLGKKIYTVGVSIWPLKLALSRFLLRRTLAKCAIVSVRESSSYKYATSVLKLTNINCDPDLSFASMPFTGLNNLDSNRTKMFITIVDWTEDGETVRRNYVKAVIHAIKWGQRNGLDPVIVPQVHHKWEDYREILSQILAEVEVEVISKSFEHEDLLSLYRSGAMLLATRMHSAIFALSEGCKVLALSYDSGAKWSILTDAGLKPSYLVKMQELAEIDIESRLDSILKDNGYWNQIGPNYRRNKNNVQSIFTKIRDYN